MIIIIATIYWNTHYKLHTFTHLHWYFTIYINYSPKRTGFVITNVQMLRNTKYLIQAPKVSWWSQFESVVFCNSKAHAPFTSWGCLNREWYRNYWEMFFLTFWRSTLRQPDSESGMTSIHLSIHRMTFKVKPKRRIRMTYMCSVSLLQQKSFKFLEFTSSSRAITNFSTVKAQ